MAVMCVVTWWLYCVCVVRREQVALLKLNPQWKIYCQWRRGRLRYYYVIVF